MIASQSDTRRVWPWLAGGAMLIVSLLLAFMIDEGLDRWIVRARTPEWEFVARMCSRFLAWHWLMLGAAGALFLAWWRQRRDWMRLLCVMMVAASLGGLTADIFRGLIGRTRPTAVAPQGWYGVYSNGEWLVFEHAFNSFPSGHTTAAAAFALPLFLWRRRYGVAVFPFIAVVAGARVSVGAHHLSDVIAGAALGSVIALLIWRRSRGGERLLSAVPAWREAA